METGCCPPPVVAPSLSIYGRVEGNNRYRKASIVDHPTSGLVSFVGEWYEKLTARAEQQDEPFITILENVGSMFLSVREELNDVLRQDVNRYIVDEMLFGGAPRKRYFWTNVLCQCIDQVSTRPSRFTQAPVEKLEQEDSLTTKELSELKGRIERVKGERDVLRKQHGEAAEIERDAIRDGASTPVGNQRYMDIPYELSAALFT